MIYLLSPSLNPHQLLLYEANLGLLRGMKFDEKESLKSILATRFQTISFNDHWKTNPFLTKQRYCMFWNFWKEPFLYCGMVNAVQELAGVFIDARSIFSLQNHSTTCNKSSKTKNVIVLLRFSMVTQRTVENIIYCLKPRISKYLTQTWVTPFKISNLSKNHRLRIRSI